MQGFAQRVMSPATFPVMERESRAWIIEGACGYRSDVWESGGIRYKARGTRGTWGKCPGPRHAAWVSDLS